jgi:hypothetical protein
VIDLGPKSRVVFAAAYFAAQAVLIGTSGKRPDHAFGFQMFSESSTLSIHLMRKVDSVTGHGTTLVDVHDGEWIARDSRGKEHRFSFRDRVKEPGLTIFDTTIHASYGADAQLARIKAALDDVAAHVPEDSETRALVADVTVRKNGKEPVVIQLTSAPP